MKAPQGWTSATLSDFARVYTGGTPSRAVPAYWDGGIPWVSTAELDQPAIAYTRETISELGLTRSAAKVAPAGTILMAMYGQGKTRGTASVLAIDAAMNQACAAIEPLPNINAHYLLSYLRYRYRSIRALSNSGGQENLSAGLVKRIVIAAPPLDHQRQIASIIQDVDVYTCALERLIAKKQAVKQGMMQQLFSEDATKSPLSSMIGSLEAGVSVNSQRDEGRFSILKTSCVSGGKFDPTEKKAIAPGEVWRAAVSPVADSLIVSRMNTPDLVGEVGYVNHDWPNVFLPDRLWLATRRLGAQINMRWLAYALSFSRNSRRIKDLATGTSGSMKNIAKGSFLGLEVAMPSLERQDYAAAVLTDADAEISTLEARLAKARAVKQGMMQQLLTGKIRLPITDSTTEDLTP